MFETVAISCHEQSLQRLVEIAEHTPIVDLVKTVHVSAAGYLEEELEDRRTQGKHNTTQLNAYEEAFESQSLILESGLVCLQLGVAFRGLRNCASVEIAQLYLSPEVEYISPRGFPQHWINSDLSPEWTRRASRIVSAVASGMNNTPSFVRELSINCEDEQSYYPIAPLTSSYAGITFTNNIFAKLCNLDLQLDSKGSTNEDACLLADSLAHCVMLRRFSSALSNVAYSSESDADVVYTEIFQRCQFPMLKDLRLYNGVFELCSVEKFLHRHRVTLETLWLCAAAINEEPLSWIELMKSMAGYFTLEEFFIQTSYEEDMEITWEGDEIPWQPEKVVELHMKGNVDQKLRRATQT